MTQKSTASTLLRGISSLSSQMIRTPRALPGQREFSRPEGRVIEGIMTLAEDKRPKATLLIGWSWYALQCQTRMR
jgi:hypothetical protein